MVFLEATYEVGDHLPFFFGVGSEVLLLALHGKLELPFALSFSLFFEEVPSCYLEELLVFGGSLFHNFFRASFLGVISSMRVFSEAVNQSGLDEMGCSAAYFAASMM
jgi:hypothetical protein